MKRLLLTISGKDKPGIIAKVSELLYRIGCNLEDVSMTLLEGQFAMMMTVCVPGSVKLNALTKAMTALKSSPWGMECFMAGLKGKATRGEKHARGVQPCLITAFGKDRTGIVHAVSKTLAQYKINITDLDCRILGGGSKVTYAMLLEVDVPKRMGLGRLRGILARVAKKLKIEIQLRPHETLSL